MGHHHGVEALTGRLLIANGNLFDPNFRQTVLLVVEHGDEGALGIVLNRPAEVSVAEAIPALASVVGPGDLLYIGGPVQPTAAIALAEFAEEADPAERLFGSIGLITGEIESLGPTTRARVFAGYAGWGAGQLEREMEENSWIVAAPTAEDVFTDGPETLWAQVLMRKGGEYKLLARMPIDPSMN
jgi:putative transcriptional regulator